MELKIWRQHEQHEPHKDKYINRDKLDFEKKKVTLKDEFQIAIGKEGGYFQYEDKLM